MFEVLPGKRGWPYHYHTANEEAIYILGGKDTLRMNGDEIEISKGDYITCPAGSGAHQIINSSDDILRYLCFSTKQEPDEVVYPDSKKIVILVGSTPGGNKEKRTLHKYLLNDTEVDYWDGEE